MKSFKSSRTITLSALDMRIYQAFGKGTGR